MLISRELENSSATVISTLTIPANNTSPVAFSLSEIPDVYSIEFRVENNKLNPIYLDNIIFNIQ